MNSLRDLWTLLSVYKLRAHDVNGKVVFSVPLSWLFVLIVFCLLRA